MLLKWGSACTTNNWHYYLSFALVSINDLYEFGVFVIHDDDDELCLWAISNETVAGIEISFKEKDTKYLEFLFVYYMDDLIREDHDWELLDQIQSNEMKGPDLERESFSRV
ncbi:hypothetical protein G4B88_029692 [Cannabis sativa]|uniref:Ycf2 N-terminal domain-containing protein n=1 Tax=Cannabis sativa TaxID=3483 RepID=A0A7J6DQ20_CANSA|nr:hypothetical protein G4B88_029692 [Cannabis sativa]